MTYSFGKAIKKPTVIRKGVPKRLRIFGFSIGLGGLVAVGIFAKALLIALLVVFVIALVVVIVVLMRRLKEAQAAEEIESSISQQADSDIERSVPGQEAEAENMKSELLQAIEALKTSKVGQRGGKAALSRLPWYMVLGPAEAGKSTLVKRSGLHFALTDERQEARSVRGVGGTRSFEWWLSEEAVLLDMPGRRLATAEFEDNADWLSFLGVLKKQRPEKPINGVIVTVGVDQVADRNDKEIEALARRIRQQVQELVHHLRVVFPVYVIFSRCDRLAGFSEFFATLNPDERSQPWGATFPLARAKSEGADALFDPEFEHLVSALSERRLPRMAEVPDPVQRARVFSFPLQLQRVRGPMRRFLTTMFEPNPVEEGPLFRGFYFACSAQEGVPQDRVLLPAARALGVSAEESTAPPLAGEGSWFANELFTRVVFPDAELAGESSQGAKLRQQARLFLIGLIGIAFVTTAVSVGAISCYNGVLLNRTREAARAVAEQVRADQPMMTNLSRLEDLRTQAAILDSLKRGTPLLRTAGGYSGNSLIDPTVRLYTDKVVETLIAPAVNDLEGTVLPAMADSGQGRFIDFYYRFRAWRLLKDPNRLGPLDSRALSRGVGSVLVTRVGTPDRKNFYTLIDRQMTFVANHKDALVARAPSHYRTGGSEGLIARGNNRLKNWNSREFYLELVDQAAGTTKALDYGALGIKTKGIISGTYIVPGPFTKDGWIKQVKPITQWWRQQMQHDWVTSEAVQGSQAPDLVHDLLTSYARDYTSHWVKFMNGLTPDDTPELQNVVSMMLDVAKDDSPLLDALKKVDEQTSLGEDPNSEIGQGLQNAFRALHEFCSTAGAVNQVGSFIGDSWRKITGGSSTAGSPPGFSTYKKLLKDGADWVAPNAKPGVPASQIAVLLKQGDSANNPLLALESWADQLAAADPGAAGAQATATVLKLPVEQAGVVVKRKLIRAWNEFVVTAYQRTLIGKYPFVADGRDVALPDFAEFFKPGGTFWSFYASNLSPYVQENGTPINEAIAAPALAECVKQAYAIRQALFATGDAPTLSFSVVLQPPDTKGANVLVRDVSLYVGGENRKFPVGARQEQALTWPGDMTQGAELRANVAPPAAAETITEQGPWGFFRILERATFTVSPSGVQLVTIPMKIGLGDMLVTFEMKSAAGQPFQKDFLRFVPPTTW